MTQNANRPELWRGWRLALGAEYHKYDRGHAFIVGGYPITGAARFAAFAAARVGAGLTTVAVPEVAFSIYATALGSGLID